MSAAYRRQLILILEPIRNEWMSPKDYAAAHNISLAGAYRRVQVGTAVSRKQNNNRTPGPRTRRTVC